ncbi:MAG: hypothetical protein JW781_11310, partial [Deltaproteobacteria bacterium]|nr:hypothetical protein [Candidatus Anaeroferrophillacea bacterium]
MKKVLALVALMVLFAGSAFAYSFPMYRGTPQLPGTQFEDDNLEYFVDNNGSNALDVGDYLYSAIEFTKVLDLVGGASAYDLNQ